MAGSHITIALLVLLTMYSVDASAIMKAPDIEDINNLDVCVDISPNCAINAFQCDTNAYVQERCMKTCNLCTNGHKEGTCSADMFECPDGSCIRQAYLCDGYNDCGDDTDEQNCQNSYITCSSDEFQCGDGACILKSQKCDHIADCFDAEDEDHCPLDVTHKDDHKPGFRKARTSPCKSWEEYDESCDKCHDCCTERRGCPEYFNNITCACENLNPNESCACYEVLTMPIPRCHRYSTNYVPRCKTCETCPLNECQTFNHKTCQCHTKFSCRARAAKLRVCAIPEAEYVEKCDTCAVCSDKCDWFNKRTCKCQRATSWVGCAK